MARANTSSPQARRNQQHGFTLIEAIVAMVLVASFGMALFSWINSNIITLSRVQEATAESAATASVLDYMSTVNPMLTPQGNANLGQYRIAWTASASVEPRDGTGYPFGISQYQIALYDTKIEVQKADGQPWFVITLEQTGYKQVRFSSAQQP